jgi:hypothetical protein
MGFFSFVKKVFAGEEDEDEKELDAARSRHGIVVDKKEMDKRRTEQEEFAENYDVWEDLKNYRSNFFMGSWINRKFKPVGDDKVKKELEELEQKRLAKKQNEKGEDEN